MQPRGFATLIRAGWVGIDRNYPALLIGGNAVLEMVPGLRIYPTPFAIIASAAAHMAAPRAT